MKRVLSVLTVVGSILCLLVYFQNCSKPVSSKSAIQSSLNDGNLFRAGALDSAADLTHFADFSTPVPASNLIADAAHSGPFGLRLNNTYFQLDEDQIVLDTTKTYKLSLWVRRISGAAGAGNIPRFYVYYVGTPDYFELTFPADIGLTWHQIEHTFVPGTSRIYIEFWIMIGNSNVVDIDDIRLEEM